MLKTRKHLSIEIKNKINKLKYMWFESLIFSSFASQVNVSKSISVFMEKHDKK